MTTSFTDEVVVLKAEANAEFAKESFLRAAGSKSLPIFSCHIE
jgi:hypothetical protein